ncbi:peptidase U32 family protein [Candidatus Shikimatogenerans bostrichidophilus]|uniref:peptidase U32 family protein n=1 Tax=Candidatus Shikimatogenerans bostrichidophilus TaxID=2943807 RepID=UPI002966396B
MKKIELLSPVGNYDSLYAAIESGADSIYYGIEQLNMRASKINFTIKDIKKINEICKKKNIKKYLTLNTIIYDHDINFVKKILYEAKEYNIDAIIAMDSFVIKYSNKLNLPIHISTQLNITNYESLKFYSKYSDVFVLSRELNLNQIKYITNKINLYNLKGFSKKKIKIEIFCHGSLCMAISGKCYLSLHTYNSSANRGVCKQNCRRKYIVKDKESNIELEVDNEYIMSSKDLCTINFLDKIIDSGVSILKIEGRNKSPEYVSKCTKCYKEAIESIYNNTYKKEKILIWINELKKVYNRGFWSGYYLGEKIGQWNNCYGSKAIKKKIFIGIVKKYYNKKKIMEIEIKSNDIKKKDKILIIGNNLGVKEIEIKLLKNENKEIINKIKKGNICTTYVPFKVFKNNKIYKII